MKHAESEVFKPVQRRHLLASDAGGCIEIPDGEGLYRGTGVVLGDCRKYKNGFDPEGDELKGFPWPLNFHSRRDPEFCMDVGLDAQSGDQVGLNHCWWTLESQQFTRTGDYLHPAGNEDLCVVYRGTTANIGKDPIILKECK